MPVSYKILPARNLVLFTYSGMVGIEESLQAVMEATAHPDHRDDMRQLCDLATVTGVERDFPALLKMQAKMLESMHRAQSERLVLFFAPTRPGQELAQMARKSWEGLNSVLVRVLDSEAQALAILGLPERSFADLSPLSV